jgi:ribonuclease E
MSDDLREAGSASATPDAARDDAAPSTGSVPAGTSSPAAERAAPEGGDDANEPEPGAEETTNGAPAAPARRRRRRGSRGGRNRRKPAVTAVGDDYHDARADRGLTTEDLAADALEEAGLRRPPAGEVAHAGDESHAGGAPEAAGRPKIGDSRPAPVTPAAAPVARSAGNGDATPATPRRRRRGGRGRGKGGSRDATRDTSRETARDASKETARDASKGTARDASSDTARGRTREGTGRRSSRPVAADLGIDDAGLDLDYLDEQTLERRRGRMRKGRPTGRYMMCVHVRPGEATQLAVLEGRHLVEHYVSRPEDDDTSIDGNIYLGRVQNVLPGMEAAFVDIGTPKNGVIYRSDVAYDESEVEEKQPRIERLLKNGQSVMVQVTKNPIGAKGARLTQEVSLAGRFVVMVPGHPDTYGISKRLPDDERKRLRRILEGLRPPDAGLIVRTAAEGASVEELERDLRRLKAQWDQISAVASRSRPPVLLYKEPPMAVRVIREEFTKEYRGVVIDDRDLYEDVRSYVEAIAPELADRIEFYDEDAEQLPLFERFHVHEQLVKALDRKVWLPSGGSLVIERTEALTVIDVNTGKNVGKSSLEETVFRNNLEAAEEVARQLRLRDIGGIIVIDFIDMEIKQNREEVLRAFKDALARDKTRTQVFEISELGLVEMTRKRISEGLVEAFSEACELCHGRGFVVDESLLG